MADEKFDVVVIGAGLGGLSAAGYMAKVGEKRVGFGASYRSRRLCS